VEEQLREALRDQVTRFELVELDGRKTAEGLESGRASLPFATKDGEVRNLVLESQPASLRGKGVDVGILRSRGRAKKVPLPPERAYRLGDCPSGDACATATVLDDDATMISGLVATPDDGISYYEPVNLLLETDRYPGLHVVYNDAATLDLAVDDETAMRPRDADDPEPRERPRNTDPGTTFDKPRFVGRATNIVLDGDRTFFNASPATVWSRQLAIFNDFTLLYEVIEPLSFENPETVRWSLDLTVKGQEAWVSGGPSTTDNDKLVAELKAPGYFLLNPVTNKEIHLFFAGYDVANVFGQAAGIGTAAGGIGGAAGNNHVFVEARTSQTAKTKWVVSAHEVGHLIGGRHGDGATNSCSTFSLIFFQIPICGTSIMAPGSAGHPDNRAAYFSDAEDRSIGAVLEAAL
jgi:hypothetical protein